MRSGGCHPSCDEISCYLYYLGHCHLKGWKAGAQCNGVWSNGVFCRAFRHESATGICRESFFQIIKLSKRLHLLLKNAIPESDSPELDKNEDNDTDIWWSGSNDTRMWNLCTDSLNVMKTLRRMALESNKFVFEYGCAPHGLNNLCMDSNKAAGPKKILSANVFIVNKTNSCHLQGSLFDKLCDQKHGKVYSLI